MPLTRYSHLADFELARIAVQVAGSDDVAELRECVTELAQRLDRSYTTTLALRFGRLSLPVQKPEGTA